MFCKWTKKGWQTQFYRKFSKKNAIHLTFKEILSKYPIKFFLKRNFKNRMTPAQFAFTNSGLRGNSIMINELLVTEKQLKVIA
jgi:hypothetical protein